MKNGISSLRRKPESSLFWIPAFAGMTVFVFCLLSFVLGPAHAQTRDGEVLFYLGNGVAAREPVRYDVDVAAEYYFNDRFSLGLDFDAFLRSPFSYDVIGFARYHFEMSKWPRYSPYVGGGMGVLANTRGQGWFDLMLPELGFLYEFTPHFYIGPNVSTHLLSGSTDTWDVQILGQAAWRF